MGLIDKSRILKILPAKDLKEICRNNNLRGYSKFKKDELIDFIIEGLLDEVLEKILTKKGLITTESVTDEEVLAAMNVSRTINDRKYLEYLLQALSVKELGLICREYYLDECPGKKKNDLLNYILDSLSIEELRRLLYNRELEIVSKNIDIAFDKIRGESNETITNIKIENEENNELVIKFRGFSWDNESYISITQENINDPDRDCDCRIGAASGLCNHFWVGMIISLKKGFFELKDWTLTKLPDDFEEKMKSIKVSESGKVSMAKGVDGELDIVDEGADDFKLSEFVNQSITLYEGEVTDIIEKQQEFQEVITNWYLTILKNVRIGPRVQKKSDFREEAIKSIEIVNLRLSEKIMQDNGLEAGDKISGNGKLTRDNFLRMYIVKNIRKINKI